jgi:hypothetical protein
MYDAVINASLNDHEQNKVCSVVLFNEITSDLSLNLFVTSLLLHSV